MDDDTSVPVDPNQRDASNAQDGEEAARTDPPRKVVDGEFRSRRAGSRGLMEQQAKDFERRLDRHDDSDSWFWH